MKKIHLIIESVLAVAVIVLYILHFTGSPKAENKAVSVPAAGSGTVVYVNIDTLFQQYSLYTELKNALQSKKDRLESDMSNKSKVYQNNVLDYQNKVSKGLITRATAADMEQQLQADQQKLLQTQQDYQNQLVEEESVMHRQLLNSIMEYLTEYNKTKGYTYILGNSFGGNVLYADQKLDVTADVLKGLNEKYQASKGKK
jgi:outer membrane protein